MNILDGDFFVHGNIYKWWSKQFLTQFSVLKQLSKIADSKKRIKLDDAKAVFVTFSISLFRIHKTSKDCETSLMTVCRH